MGISPTTLEPMNLLSPFPLNCPLQNDHDLQSLAQEFRFPLLPNGKIEVTTGLFVKNTATPTQKERVRSLVRTGCNVFNHWVYMRKARSLQPKRYTLTPELRSRTQVCPWTAK